MKSRLLDAMADGLALMKKSNLLEATRLLRKTLSRQREAGAPRDAGGAPPPPVFAFAPPPRAPLGDVLEALRAGRAQRPKSRFAPAERPAPPPDDNFTSRNYRGPAGSLDYRLYVPSDHAERRLALVLMLHGCTQNPEDFAVGTRMNRVADEFGLVVAYPRQPAEANAQGCWNWFDRRHQRRDSGEPAKLAGLARILGNEFGVGRERTFVAGLSAGGAMAEVLAATYPDVFEAVGIHSGLPYGAARDVPSAFAAMRGIASAEPALRAVGENECRRIVFHGGGDATVHPVNAERILARARSDRLKQVDIESQIDGRRVTRTVLEDPAGQAAFELWSLEGGGHAWFGGDRRGSYTEEVGLDASRTMARFFLKQ